MIATPKFWLWLFGIILTVCYIIAIILFFPTLGWSWVWCYKLDQKLSYIYMVKEGRI